MYMITFYSSYIFYIFKYLDTKSAKAISNIEVMADGEGFHFFEREREILNSSELWIPKIQYTLYNP